MLLGNIISFVLGLIIGSFLNVCIERIPKGQSIIGGRSKCPYCKNTIAWYDNIPLLSYILLKGRCRNCNTKISFQYPLVELFTAIITLALFLKFNFTFSFLFYSIFSYFLIIIGFIDLKTNLILNKILLPMFIIGVIVNIWGHVIPILDAALGSILGGAVMLVVAILGSKFFKKEALGMGDVKLSFVAGWYLGWKQILMAIYFGFIIALIAIGIIWILKRTNIPKLIPLGPFLAAGFMLYLFYGHQLVHWYLNIFI